MADAAGVSIKTVSRVFNDEPNVRPNTRARVLEVAGVLDYHPNIAARSLAGRRSFLIGLAYDNPSPNYVVSLQNGAADRVRGSRWRILFLPTPPLEGDSGQMAATARTLGLDGLVLGAPLCDNLATLAALDAAHIPYVRIAPTRPGHAPDIRIDDVAASRAVVEHLAELGHRRIALVLGDPSHGSALERAQGFDEAMAARGLAVDEALRVPGSYTYASGLEAGRRLLTLPEPPTAIFASNDDMAAGVLSAAHEAGVSVPGQLSIVGYDDSNIASVVWPRLTTVRQPVVDMADAATDMLLALIEDRDPPAHATLPHELVVRGSTGPA